MMECFVKFSPKLYSCHTHYLALLKPPLPAKRTVHSFSYSWMTRQYELVIQIIITQQVLHHSHSTHTQTQTHTYKYKCPAVATRVLGRAKRDAGTVKVRGGAVQQFPPCFRYSWHFSQTILISRLLQSLYALVTAKDLWLGMNAVRPIRTGYKKTKNNYKKTKTAQVWECVWGSTLPQQGQLATAGHNRTSLKKGKSYIKKMKKPNSESN